MPPAAVGAGSTQGGRCTPRCWCPPGPWAGAAPLAGGWWVLLAPGGGYCPPPTPPWGDPTSPSPASIPGSHRRPSTRGRPALTPRTPKGPSAASGRSLLHLIVIRCGLLGFMVFDSVLRGFGVGFGVSRPPGASGHPEARGSGAVLAPPDPPQAPKPVRNGGEKEDFGPRPTQWDLLGVFLVQGVSLGGGEGVCKKKNNGSTHFENAQQWGNLGVSPSLCPQNVQKWVNSDF